MCIKTYSISLVNEKIHLRSKKALTQRFKCDKLNLRSKRR
nr:MAG TPA: hypothetical protein [Caudoviricetes sp.]